METKTLWEKIKLCVRYLLGWEVEGISFTFESRLKVDKFPKGRWIFVSSLVHFNKIGDWWLEDVRIIDQKTGMERKKLFTGELSDLAIHKK